MVRLKVTNKNYFVPLDYVDISVVVVRDGFDIGRSTIPNDPVRGMVPIGPRKTESITVPIRFANDENIDAHCYDLRVEFLLRHDMPWADKGYVQMSEQVDLWGAGDVKPLFTQQKDDAKLNISQSTKESITVIRSQVKQSGQKPFTVTFDDALGTIHYLGYGGESCDNADIEDIIEPGCGPVINALRAPVDNDNWFYQSWYQNGLHNLSHKAISRNVYTRKDGAVVLNYVVESRGTKGAIHGGSSGRYTIEDKGEKADFFFLVSFMASTLRIGFRVMISSACSQS
jgi:beta-galactosidase